MEKNDKSLNISSVRVRTLGCKVNFCDGRALAETLAAAGLTLAASGSQADVEVINTCAVTSRSVQKARTLARRIMSENPDATVILTGCAVRLPENPFSSVPGIDAVCLWPQDVVEFLKPAVAHRARTRATVDFERTRAFLKIQDGCEAACTYCIVPSVRGTCRSIEPGEVVRIIEDTVRRGYREIVLCGIHLGGYGHDLKGASLEALMAEVTRLPGDFRVRLSSIEPLEVTEGVLNRMADGNRFCPHLHLPLQSGSDRILSAMGRPYRLREYMATLVRARQFLNNPAVTTDIMVGFPGETEEDHAMTLEAIRAASFARGHVFVFSPRAGTPAASMRERVNSLDGKRRSREAREACAATGAAYRESLAGAVAEVVIERVQGGVAEGLCRRYQRVRFVAGGARCGEKVNVEVKSAGPDGLLEAVKAGPSPAGGRGRLR